MPKDFSRQLKEYQDRAIHLESNPLVVYLESVKGCPYSCAMCHFRQTQPQRMAMDLLDKIEPYFQDLELLTIHGAGEPLLGDLDYFVAQSQKHDLVLHMNTTAFFMTERVADLLAETRLSIRFSIHSGKPATYKKIMGHDFERVRKNIAYLMQKTRALGNRNDFWFSFIVMRENLGDVADFLHLAHDLGIKNVRFMELLPNWQSIKGHKMPDGFTFRFFEQSNKRVTEAFLQRWPEYLSLAKELGIGIRYGTLPAAVEKAHNLKLMINGLTKLASGRHLLPLKKHRGSCLAPWIGQPVIGQNGNVRLCCLTDYSLGNLHESSLPEIWNSARMKKIRRTFKEGYIPRICGFCRGFDFNNYPLNTFPGVPR